MNTHDLNSNPQKKAHYVNHITFNFNRLIFINGWYTHSKFHLITTCSNSLEERHTRRRTAKTKARPNTLSPSHSAPFEVSRGLRGVSRIQLDEGNMKVYGIYCVVCVYVNDVIVCPLLLQTPNRSAHLMVEPTAEPTHRPRPSSSSVLYTFTGAIAHHTHKSNGCAAIYTYAYGIETNYIPYSFIHVQGT